MNKSKSETKARARDMELQGSQIVKSRDREEQKNTTRPIDGKSDSSKHEKKKESMQKRTRSKMRSKAKPKNKTKKRRETRRRRESKKRRRLVQHGQCQPISLSLQVNRAVERPSVVVNERFGFPLVSWSTCKCSITGQKVGSAVDGLSMHLVVHVNANGREREGRSRDSAVYVMLCGYPESWVDHVVQSTVVVESSDRC